jgi:hypothetical protein
LCVADLEDLTVERRLENRSCTDVASFLCLEGVSLLRCTLKQHCTHDSIHVAVRERGS